MRTFAALTAIATTLLVGTTASGQSASADAATLFEQGRTALAAKDYATACPKFEESLRLERAVGTLISLAQCEEGAKKLASARQHWKEAADYANATHDRLDRAPYALKRLAEIEPRVPRLLIELTASAPPDTHVSRDGIDLGGSPFTPVFVDPGSHTLRVTAPGRSPRVVEVVIEEAEKKTITVEPGPPEASPSAAQPSRPAPDESERPSGTGRRMIGWIVVGVGVAGVGVGAVTGLLASSKWSDAKAACGAGCREDSDAEKQKSDAESLATVSTIAFVAGGAAVVAGGILVLTAPKTSQARVRITPAVGRGTAGIAFGGSW